MNKTIALLVGAGMLSSSLYAGVCSDGFKVNFTFYGAPDKSYIITKNTFTKMTTNFPEEKLLNSTVEIDATSLDTSADMNNNYGGKKGVWPAIMSKTRNNNTINNFFKKFENDPAKVSAKIVKVEDAAITVAITMNGVTKELPFTYAIEGDVLKAQGKVDVLNFNTNVAWEQFKKSCSLVFHHGKSWSELDVFFEVPASCK